MSELVNASQQWKLLTRDLSTFDRCNLGRDILRKKPSEAALIRDIDLNGLGLHFDEYPSRIKESDEDSAESDDISSSPIIGGKKGQDDKATKILKQAIENPDSLTKLRKVHNRQSGAALFKKYDATVESFSNSTVKFTDGTVLRQSDLQFKPVINSDSFPVGKQKGAMKEKIAVSEAEDKTH